jgi:hypothetical protein
VLILADISWLPTYRDPWITPAQVVVMWSEAKANYFRLFLWTPPKIPSIHGNSLSLTPTVLIPCAAAQSRLNKFVLCALQLVIPACCSRSATEINIPQGMLDFPNLWQDHATD